MRRLMVLAVAGLALSASHVSGALALQQQNAAKRADDRWKVPPGKAKKAEDSHRDRDDRYDNRRNDTGRVAERPRGNDDGRYGRTDDDRYDRRDRDDRYDRRRDVDWWENRRVRDDGWLIVRRGSGKGPAFCRSGAGHPVYGRQWCIQRGYGLGRDVRWDRVRWDDVIFRRTLARADYQFGRGGLIDVLGDVVFGRLDARRRYLGIGAPLSGRWFLSDERAILLVSAGGMPLAELVDVNRDRRVDLILVNFGR